MSPHVDIGAHEFTGSCAPKPGEPARYATFSVGIYQVVAASKGRVKRGPVKVRVTGPTIEPEKVYKKAKEIVALLDRGWYAGPRTVVVK